MSKTLTVRLPDDLCTWLEEAAARTGVSQGRLIREQLDRARTGDRKSFMRLAGSVKAARALSTRKGFSRK